MTNNLSFVALNLLYALAKFICYFNCLVFLFYSIVSFLKLAGIN